MPGQFTPRGLVAFAGFGKHDQTFRCGALIGTGERRDPAPANSGQLADGALEFVGENIAPGANDQVLDAAGDVNLATGDIGEIAGVEPVAVQQRVGRVGIVEVTAGR